MTGKAKWRVESKKFQVVTRFDSLILEEDREFFVSKVVEAEKSLQWTVYSESETDSSGAESVFFDVEFYRGKIIPIEQMREEISTYFAEHLRNPTSRIALWNGNDWQHTGGTLYSEIFSQAMAAAKTRPIRERFEAEGRGWEKGGSLAKMHVPFLFVSLPADIYRTKYGAKNMTYLVEHIKDEDGVSVWNVLSIPSQEMTAVEHARAVWPIVGELTSLDPNYLIANPQIATALLSDIDQLTRLNQMAVDLGYKSYQEILSLANESLQAENDPHSLDRRNALVAYFAEAFVDAQGGPFYAEDKRMLIQRVLAEAMRYFFALEAGSAYLEKDFVEIEPIVAQYVQDKVRRQELSTKKENAWALSTSELLELWEMRERDSWRRHVLMANEKALESYQVTGCVLTYDLPNGKVWNELILDSASQQQLNTLFGGEVKVGFESDEESRDLADGETACYRCPVCEAEGHTPGGEVKRVGNELVCQDNKEKHRIQYKSKAD